MAEPDQKQHVVAENFFFCGVAAVNLDFAGPPGNPDDRSESMQQAVGNGKIFAAEDGIVSRVITGAVDLNMKFFGFAIFQQANQLFQQIPDQRKTFRYRFF